MAKQNVTISDLSGGMTMRVVVSISREFKFRLWLGFKLIRMASIVMKLPIVIEKKVGKTHD